MTYILGLSFNYHDSAAALIKDGEVLAAAEEERFSRIKHDHGFPRRAIAFCLEEAGIESQDLDHVTFYEYSILKFDRIVRSAVRARHQRRNNDYLTRVVEGWLHEGKFDDCRMIATELTVPRDHVNAISHHLSHASAAFLAGPFERATVVTMDGVGEYDTLTVWEGNGTRLDRLYGLEIPESLGLFYSAFTAFLGFEVNEGEYKVMGMAPYGAPRYLDVIRPLIRLTPDGLFAIDQGFFEFECPEELPFTPRLVELLGPTREPESAFEIAPAGVVPPAGSVEATSQHFADIAASVQACVEEVILHVVRHAVKRTGIQDVCIAGGVGLNSVANARIQRELGGVQLYVHPAAGDAGAALGAAMYQHHTVLGNPRRPGGLIDPYLGKAYRDDEIIAALNRHGIEEFIHLPDQNELLQAVVDRLVEGKVIRMDARTLRMGTPRIGQSVDHCRSDPERHEGKGE